MQRYTWLCKSFKMSSHDEIPSHTVHTPLATVTHSCSLRLTRRRCGANDDEHYILRNPHTAVQ
jgi:hypothetical protein